MKGTALEATEKIGSRGTPSPQRLKPFLLLMTYVRAEARTLQKNEFFRKLFSRAVKSHSNEGFNPGRYAFPSRPRAVHLRHG
jgi:hypothetical protein